MITEINIGGRLRPIRFGFNALSDFCTLTGMKIGDLDKIGSGMDFSHIRALVFCGLKAGARRAGEKFTATLEDVGDWMDDNPESLVACFDEFVASQAPVVEKKSSGENP